MNKELCRLGLIFLFLIVCSDLKQSVKAILLKVEFHQLIISKPLLKS